MPSIKESLKVVINILKCTPSKEYEQHCNSIARVNSKVTALEFKIRPFEAEHS